jgi:hypothetical protein
MRKYAILDNNTVTEVLDLTEDGYAHEASYHQLIIDIEDLIVQPQVGWILNGNHLTPPPEQAIDMKAFIMSKIKFYQEQAPELLRDLYATNTLLGITTATSDQMFTDFQDVLIRIREGAWPTALYKLAQKTPSGFVTQQMIDSWTILIQSRMS